MESAWNKNEKKSYKRVSSVIFQLGSDLDTKLRFTGLGISLEI